MQMIMERNKSGLLLMSIFRGQGFTLLKQTKTNGTSFVLKTYYILIFVLMGLIANCLNCGPIGVVFLSPPHTHSGGDVCVQVLGLQGDGVQSRGKAVVHSHPGLQQRPSPVLLTCRYPPATVYPHTHTHTPSPGHNCP